MSTDANNSPQVDVRDRIANFMKTDGQVRPKEMAQEDVQTLRAAAGRLDQLLNEIEEARRKEAREKDMKMLQAATSCLDHLLAGMTGKEAMPELKLRPKRDTTK